MIPLCVTVSSAGHGALRHRARAAALAWGLPYWERPRKASLLEELGVRAQAFLVLEGKGFCLTDGLATLRFSPGMAWLRILRVDAGHHDDLLVRFAELRGGDSVFDCTFGLGADALLAARVVGPQGRVVACEKSLALFALAQQALEQPLRPDCARVELQHADAREALARLPPASVDVVLVDPMFERPRASSPAFAALRRWADPQPLGEDLLVAARRVARRWVLVKAGRSSRTLARLGLTALPTRAAADVAWARLPGA